MEKITAFDRDNLKDLRGELKDAFSKIQETYGIKLEIGNISYSREKFTARLTATCGGEAEKTYTDRRLEQAKSDFKFKGWIYGMITSDLGRTFEWKGEEYTLIGLNTRTKKNPFYCQKKDGAIYRFSADIVKMLLGIESR